MRVHVVMCMPCTCVHLETLVRTSHQMNVIAQCKGHEWKGAMGGMRCMLQGCQAPVAAIDITAGSPHPNCGKSHHCRVATPQLRQEMSPGVFLFVIQYRRNARHVIRTWTCSVSPESAPCDPHMDGFSVAGIRAM